MKQRGYMGAHRKHTIRHREGQSGRSLCGRINCDAYPEFVLPAGEVDCPECQARLTKRHVA